MSKESKATASEFWIRWHEHSKGRIITDVQETKSIYPEDIHVIEYSAYAELQDKLFVCEGISENNIKNHSYDLWKKDKALLEERAKSARLLEALERLTKVGPPSRSCTGQEYTFIALHDNCDIAKKAIADYNQREGGE